MKIGASKSPVLIGLIAASAGFAALAAVIKGGPMTAPGELKPQFTRKPGIVSPPSVRTDRTERPVAKAHEEATIPVEEHQVVRYATMSGETPTLSKEIALKPGEDPHERSLAATIKSLGYGDVRVLGVNVEKGAAMVDVNPALTSEGFSSSSEAALIEAMARTLGQFQEIKTFQLRIDGQVVDTLGHLELSEPVKVLRPGERTNESDSPSREPNP